MHEQRFLQSPLFLPHVPCLSHRLAVPTRLTAALAGGLAEQVAPRGLKQQLADTEPGETLPKPRRRHSRHLGQRSLRGPKVMAGAVIPARGRAGAELTWLCDRTGRPGVSTHLAGADASMTRVTPRSGRCQQQLASLAGPLTSHGARTGRFKAGCCSTCHSAGSRWWSLPPQTHQVGPLPRQRSSAGMSGVLPCFSSSRHIFIGSQGEQLWPCRHL